MTTSVEYTRKRKSFFQKKNFLFLPVLYLPLPTFLLKVRKTGYALDADAVGRHVSQPKLKSVRGKVFNKK